MEIKINGIKYQKIENQPRKNSKTMSKVLTLAAMFGGLDDLGGKTIKRPDIILEQEYELIQQKKSKLSRKDRDWVVFKFERQYKRID